MLYSQIRFFVFFFPSKIEFLPRIIKKKKKETINIEILQEMYSGPRNRKYTFDVPVGRLALLSRETFDAKHIFLFSHP